MSDSDISRPRPEPAASIANRLFVLILQHPQERRERLATAALAAAALHRARLVTGLSWRNLGHALGAPADPRRWAVLYLGSAQPRLLAPTRDILLIGQDGTPFAEPQPVLRSLEGIVLLDGSWKEAKTLWWRNPWLLKLHRMVLNPPTTARLGQVRREPRRDALSTLEAAALALRRLEAGPQAADALMAALDRLLQAAPPRLSPSPARREAPRPPRRH